MKSYFFVFLFFAVGLPRAMSQTADIAISYVLREVQIHLAKEYNKELSRSLPKFTEYSIENALFYRATKTGSIRGSSFLYTFPTNPCATILLPINPLKLTRCRKKIKLLKFADRLVRSIPLTTTEYTPKSAVQSNIMVKTNSILRDINIKLLKH